MLSRAKNTPTKYDSIEANNTNIETTLVQSPLTNIACEGVTAMPTYDILVLR